MTENNTGSGSPEFDEAVELMNRELESDLAEVRKTLGMRIVAQKRYEKALQLFESVLENEPENTDIQHWIEACRIMLRPYEPVQHTESESGGQMADTCYPTPWEQRAFYLGALEKLGKQALSETAQVFHAAEEKALQQAEAIFAEAKQKTEADLAHLRNRLEQLQENLDREWKGHGPDILSRSLERLKHMFPGKG